MAALGAVAAGEYLENRAEAGDEARIAAMQGQSMALPGGAPPGIIVVAGPVIRYYLVITQLLLVSIRDKM